MVADIGLMIRFYILTRMSELFAVLTVLITLIALGDILLTGSDASTMMENM